MGKNILQQDYFRKKHFAERKIIRNFAHDKQEFTFTT